MRERVRRILDVLLALEPNAYIPVAVLAEETGAGIRTIFRDIQELDFFLRDFSVNVEKRRSVGIRLVGDTSSLEPSEKKECLRLSGLDIAQRQSAILVYLGRAERVVKLGELATVFSVSDSCVSNDLRDLDERLRERGWSASLVRQKGIGVSFAGREWDVRLAVINAAIQLIPSREMIQLFLSADKKTRLDRTMQLLGFTADRCAVLEAVREAEVAVGYRFSWYDLGILFIYLMLAIERNDVSLPLSSPLDSGLAPDIPELIARKLWCAVAPEDTGEIKALCGVLSALEPGELRETIRCNPAVPELVSALVAELGRSGNIRYDLDSRLVMVLQSGISALAYKKLLGLPVRPTTLSALGNTIRENGRVYDFLSPALRSAFGVDISESDVEGIEMAIRAADETNTGAPQKFRVLVTCFEGICLAQFIASLIRRHFSGVTVVASLSCDRISDEWLLERGIDLVITTFPSGLVAAPEYVVDTPFNATSFRAGIAEVLARIEPVKVRVNETEYIEDGKAIMQSTVSGESSGDVGIDIAITILLNFSLTVLPAPIPEGEITRAITGIILGNGTARDRLAADFDKREAHGAVILEQSSLRMFHCRSAAIDRPVAGVVRVAGSRDVYVYLAAPDPAHPETIRALSLVSVALMDSPDFSRALVYGTESDIKRQLFSYLAGVI